jgi:hypothetical protein
VLCFVFEIEWLTFKILACSNADWDEQEGDRFMKSIPATDEGDKLRLAIQDLAKAKQAKKEAKEDVKRKEALVRQQINALKLPVSERMKILFRIN